MLPFYFKGTGFIGPVPRQLCYNCYFYSDASRGLTLFHGHHRACTRAITTICRYNNHMMYSYCIFCTGVHGPLCETIALPNPKRAPRADGCTMLSVVSACDCQRRDNVRSEREFAHVLGSRGPGHGECLSSQLSTTDVNLYNDIHCAGRHERGCSPCGHRSLRSLPNRQMRHHRRYWPGRTPRVRTGLVSGQRGQARLRGVNHVLSPCPCIVQRSWVKHEFGLK